MLFLERRLLNKIKFETDGIEKNKFFHRNKNLCVYVFMCVKNKNVRWENQQDF
jgi:hypothetical protein